MRIAELNVWVWSRVAVLLLGVLGAKAFVPGPRSPFAGGSIALLPLFFASGAIAIIFVVGLQAINPRSAIVWIKPDWRANPFLIRQPLQFFHLCGYFMVATGVAAGVITLLRHLSGWEPLLPIAFGAGILLGTKCCLILYRRKFGSP
jgi:hypothetical protein